MRGPIGDNNYAARAEADERKEAAERVKTRHVDREGSIINRCLDEYTARFIRTRTIGDDGADFIVFRLRKLLDHVDQVITDSQLDDIHTLDKEEIVEWNTYPF